VSAIISGANPILNAIRLADRRVWAACERGPRPRRVPGTFARAGKIQKKVRTAARCETPLAKSLTWQFAAPGNAAAVRFRNSGNEILTQKTRGRFPGAGFLISAMMRLCR
jgi:hypothetical protein